MDALRFIHAFALIISKAAMQTYYSALPLMPSTSLLSKRYSASSQPSLKLSEPSYSQIINHPQVILPSPKCLFDSTISDDIIALSHDGGIAFFDTRTGNEFGSRIPTPDCFHYLIAFSPDGKWIAVHWQGDYSKHHSAVDIWDVETCTCVKTVETNSEHAFEHEHITYSADGERVMVVTVPIDILLPRCRLVFILDVKTDKSLKQLKVEAIHVAISPDGSQIAISNKLGIKIIDVSTGHIVQQITPYSLWSHPDPLIVWSPNGQFLASASVKQYKKTEIHLLSLTHGSAQVQIPSPTPPVGKYIADVACSPDSSKVIAVLWDYEAQKMTLYIYCTQSGALIRTIPFNSTMGDATLSFAADGQDILICAYNLNFLTPQNYILHRFSVVPTHLETYMNHPPKFHPSQTPHTIQYSHHISGAIDDYASHVDKDGWILNTKGEREIWTPWANYELLCTCKSPQKGQTQYRTLEVKDPKTKTIVLIYVIAFEQKDVNIEIQEAGFFVE